MLAPLAPPRDLTIPTPGSGTGREILSRAIRRLLSELPHVGRGLPLSPGIREDLSAFQRWLKLVFASHPGALASSVRRPTVGALIRCLRAGRLPPTHAEPVLAELMGTLYLELAIHRAIPERARLRHPPPRITSLLARATVTLPPDVAEVTFENGRMMVTSAAHGQVTVALDGWEAGEAGVVAEGVQVTQHYHPIDATMMLALTDNNPVSMEEAHPDKQGNAIALGGRPITEWLDALRAALAPIERYLPDLRGEMALFLHQIVPVGHDEERHLSASYQEAIGTIYLSLHPAQMTLTEALIHEFSHNKLNALFELDDVLENAFSPLYTSPVRPDPRPLHGVLLAVHAFLPVARLYERMLAEGDPLAQHPSFAARFAQIRAINREGAEVLLAHAKPTPVGRGLIDEIRQWHDHFSRV
ncbi:aKG-HExxH-type peptide beta-hydroxylase [Chondromyces apiculatus]|uniref:HEXXH motif domain-containing protein n=1 Tax=Chondromyces apiculatus DSM 436 TaxID=1192034 RepID=A0A017TBC0_9BACT|nr:HEXXH motif-containing putative peptide modification protein [Chondromyces apiculatus]EYF06558.1 Hypothetical protein CAP_1688 [Chondromyces apiculatus DSM 436]